MVEQGKHAPLSEDEIAQRKRLLAEVLAYFDALPHQNEQLTSDEIIGYNSEGHFDSIPKN